MSRTFGSLLDIRIVKVKEAIDLDDWMKHEYRRKSYWLPLLSSDGFLSWLRREIDDAGKNAWLRSKLDKRASEGPQEAGGEREPPVDIIERWRKTMGYTNVQAAKAAGISTSSLNRIKNESRVIGPTLRMLGERIAADLKMEFTFHLLEPRSKNKARGKRRVK